MHNVGTVPTFKMHNVGTAPTYKTHNIETELSYATLKLKQAVAEVVPSSRWWLSSGSIQIYLEVKIDLSKSVSTDEKFDQHIRSWIYSS